jgi:hypothetical protein
MQLTDLHLAALALITDHELATMPREAFDAATDEATAAELLTLGLVEVWDRVACGWSIGRAGSEKDPQVMLNGEPLEIPQVTLTPYGAAVIRVEIVERSISRPVWDDIGKPIKPWKAEMGEREYPMPYPERIIDPRPGPAEEVELMMDPYTGEEVRLFAGGESGRGLPVVIDRRLGKGGKRAG